MPLPTEPLEFPRGVRFPRPDEIPGRRGDALARIATAQISTGYVQKATNDPGYSAYFEINVHARHVWKVFADLVEVCLPEVACPLIAWKDEEPVFGPYTDRSLALAVFAEHADHLANDGFLQFGIMFQHQGRTEEVFVSPVKYLKVLTNRPDDIRRALEAHGLNEMPEIQFIDEYPTVTERLKDPDQSTSEIIGAISSAFTELPRR